jgi:hypothetical protein
VELENPFDTCEDLEFYPVQVKVSLHVELDMVESLLVESKKVQVPL